MSSSLETRVQARNALLAATLPSYTLRSLLNFLECKGLARTKLLNLLNCDDAALYDADSPFPARDYETLLSYGADALSIPNIGFEHGKAFEVSVWGILGYIVLAAPTLQEALSYQKRYQCLLGNSGLAYHDSEFNQNTGEQVVTMRWLSECCSSANSVEQVITAWLAFAFQYTQSPQSPLSVHFTHEALVDTAQYEAFFRCPVHFNAEFNGVRIRASSLSLPLQTSNAEVLNVLLCHAEQKLSVKRAAASLDIIRQYIIEVLPQHVPDLAEIAHHLGMSTRQLQRQFQKHNTNLTAFLEEIRLSLAVSYLTQTDHKLLYIAQVLGYSEQSAFQRAFKRHFGVTPGDYRLNPTPPLVFENS